MTGGNTRTRVNTPSSTDEEEGAKSGEADAYTHEGAVIATLVIDPLSISGPAMAR